MKINEIKEAEVVFIDTETSGLYPWRDGAIMAGLSIKVLDGPSAYIDIRHPESSYIKAHKLLTDVIEACRGKTIVMHNAKFDLAVLYQDGFDLSNERIIDTMVLTRLVYEDEFDYTLKYLGAKFVDKAAKEQQQALKVYMRKHKITSYADVPDDVMRPYAIQDVILTEGLYKMMHPYIIGRGLGDLLEMEISLTKTLFDMERVGLGIDLEHIHREAAALTISRKKLELDAFTFAGREFNLGSSQDIGKVFGGLGIHSSIKTPKGRESWSSDAFELIEHPLAETIRSWRTVTLLLNRYYDIFIELHDPYNNMHPNFNQAGAKTGRLSCRTPNMQNIPKFGGGPVSRTKNAAAMAAEGRKSIEFPDEVDQEDSSESVKKVRSSFVPRDGYFFLFVDWSQIELRVLAEYSKEPEMLKAFEYGLDIHTLTAVTAFGTLPEKGSEQFKRMRDQAKQINFGLVYGMGNRLLAARLGISQAKAKEFMKAFDARFRKVKGFSTTVTGVTEERGWLKNKWGRRRYIPTEFSYAGVNFLIQGTAADLMKETLVSLDRNLKGLESRILITVHDEVMVEVKYGEEEAVLPIVLNTMMSNPKIAGRLAAEATWSPASWGDKRSLKCSRCSGDGFIVIGYTKEQLEDLLLAGKISTIKDVISDPCNACDGIGHTIGEVTEWRQKNR